ncbi:MAG: hypothetical protein IJ004_06240 [Clostridia bacterium]|nr:hypothetical protein [Clostridia bacterium]
MWDKVGYLLAVVGFCFLIFKAYESLKEDGFFVKSEARILIYAMNQILLPYSSLQSTIRFKNRYHEKIKEIANHAKTRKVEKEFIEKSKVDGGAHVFALIYVLCCYDRGAFCTDADNVAINALFDYCKKELLKYKDCAPEIFWSILYLDKESFYQEKVEKISI